MSTHEGRQEQSNQGIPRVEQWSLDEVRKLSALPEVFQHRDKNSRTVIRDYRNKYRNGEAFPPLTVAEINKGMFLIDGFHRFWALWRIYGPDAPKTIPVEIFQCKDTKEALWIGAQKNMRHGLRLTTKERRNIFNIYVQAKMHWKEYRKEYKSWRQIGKDHGIDHKTAQMWMKEDHRKIWQNMTGKDGHDMQDVDTGKRIKPWTLAEFALECATEIFRTTQGIQKESERLEVIRAVRDLHKRLVQEQYDKVSPEGARGLFADPEMDF